MVRFPVELFKFCSQTRACRLHDFLALREHLVVQDTPAVSRHEHEVTVERGSAIARSGGSRVNRRSSLSTMAYLSWGARSRLNSSVSAR